MRRTRIGLGLRRLGHALVGTRGLRATLAVSLATLLATSGVVWGATSVRAATVLSFAQTVSGTAMVGQNLTFSVTMTNTGTTAISEGIVDAPPVGPEASFISLKSTGITCDRLSAGAIVLCSPVQLAPGASVGFDLTLRPLIAGLLSNTAQSDPDFLYSSTVTIQVAPAPTDVQVTGSASTGSPNRGASFSYTFQVKDNGPWSVGDVTFSDPLPTQVSFVGVSTSNGSACSQTGGAVSCDLGGLNVGQQVNVVITVLAPTAPSTFTNTATVAANVSDTQPSNNSVSVTVQVK